MVESDYALRLTSAESAARAELNALKISFAARERELQYEIDRLYDEVWRPPTVIRTISPFLLPIV